eukprot:350949-Chlamydomonas_euryale.AAC.4
MLEALPHRSPAACFAQPWPSSPPSAVALQHISPATRGSSAPPLGGDRAGGGLDSLGGGTAVDRCPSRSPGLSYLAQAASQGYSPRSLLARRSTSPFFPATQDSLVEYWMLSSLQQLEGLGTIRKVSEGQA